MFCPTCGTVQGEELKFCNKCGANLRAVRQVVATRETDETFDWSKTWLTEMFLSQNERNKRKLAEELERGLTPEAKRFNEIKGGVITTCVSLGLMVFLYIFMQGIILSGNADPKDAEIISRIWLAALVPFMVGIGLIINGLFVSRKMVEVIKQNSRQTLSPSEIAGKTGGAAPALNPAETSEFISSDFSVVDNTTELLKNPVKRKE